MKPRRKYSEKIVRRPHRSKASHQLKPQADGRLKKIFADIGVPEKKVFTPDPFQLQAVETIRHTDCLVTAPTGSGKTWIAEQAISRVLTRGGRSWYACPLKALSNAKLAEFQQIFGAQHVGILTGDRKENPNAAIIVGTTEILRNQLYDAMSRGESLMCDLVVLDEAHFLGDADRGVVWEEIMIYLPSRIPLLLLSATIGNAREVVGWLSKIRSKPCALIEETQRPVPLFPLVLHPSGTLLPLAAGDGARLNPKVGDLIKSRRRPLTTDVPAFGAILRVLKKYHLLPAIFFLKSRADCDNALLQCLDNRITSPHHLAELKRRIEQLTARMPHIAIHRQLWHLQHLTVGAHHAGQLPSWKLVLEKLMTEGLLDAVFATSTVAAGVNFPARTVVFLNSDRFNGREFSPLSPTEFHQMTGRAGRRGMDNIGFALAVPGKFMDLKLTLKLLHSPPSRVNSQITINFSMVLNLLLSHTPEQIEDLLKRSFAAHQAKFRSRTGSTAKSLWLDFQHHLSFLKQNGFVDQPDRLTSDGIWASQLRVDQPLLIAEGFRLGILPEKDPAILAGVMASFVNEKETDDRMPAKSVPKSLARQFEAVTKTLWPLAKRMIAEGFPVRPLFLRPAVAVHAWASGMPWENTSRLAEMEEGDLAMLILRTADNLRHIRALDRVFPQAAATAAEAINLILRDPVTEHFGEGGRLTSDD
jgi:ATP-dependent RNA helicase HelY